MGGEACELHTRLLERSAILWLMGLSPLCFQLKQKPCAVLCATLSALEADHFQMEGAVTQNEWDHGRGF